MKHLRIIAYSFIVVTLTMPWFKTPAVAAGWGSLMVNVPYVSQVPDSRWVNPWANACEEASTMMVAYYYSRINDPTKVENKMNMQSLFKWEDATFGNNYDTNADQTAELINTTAPFKATVVRNPSADDIKMQLWSGRPVIATVDQYDLYNTNNKRKKGVSFHMVVITGYDDIKGTFLVYDPATPSRTQGTNYTYARVMNALHDYNRGADEANGEPTVLFTDVK